VSHSRGSYEVSFLTLDEAFQSIGPAWVITDKNLAKHYPAHLYENMSIALPPGETTKSLHYLGTCLEWLAETGATRASTVVAFGGGVIGDLAGFVAATYMRGVRYVQVPTTLLAQVDSAVGGKVGVDLEAGKNLAGSFYPPAAVHVCLATLLTLDERQ